VCVCVLCVCVCGGLGGGSVCIIIGTINFPIARRSVSINISANMYVSPPNSRPTTERRGI
jgi:hypothetical protein